MPISNSYSAILTTYNAQDTFQRAFQSIINQSKKPDEIIIVDDASTDKTFAIIKRIAGGNERIKIIKSTTNLGPANSRNLGVSVSKNDFLVFFDDDDESEESRVEIQIKNLKHSDLNYASSQKIYSKEYTKDFINNEFNGKIDSKEFLEYLLIGSKNSNFRFSIPASTMAIRRIAFNDLGGFDNNFRRLEDVDLAIRAADAGLTFSFTSNKLVKRYHSVAKDKSPLYESESQMSLIRKYENRLNPRKYKQIRDWYFVRSYYFNKKYLRLFFKLAYFILRYGLSKEMLLTGINRFKHDQIIKSAP